MFFLYGDLMTSVTYVKHFECPCCCNNKVTPWLNRAAVIQTSTTTQTQ